MQMFAGIAVFLAQFEKNGCFLAFQFDVWDPTGTTRRKGIIMSPLPH